MPLPGPARLQPPGSGRGAGCLPAGRSWERAGAGSAQPALPPAAPGRRGQRPRRPPPALPQPPPRHSIVPPPAPVSPLAAPRMRPARRPPPSAALPAKRACAGAVRGGGRGRVTLTAHARLRNRGGARVWRWLCGAALGAAAAGKRRVREASAPHTAWRRGRVPGGRQARAAAKATSVSRQRVAAAAAGGVSEWGGLRAPWAAVPRGGGSGGTATDGCGELGREAGPWRWSGAVRRRQAWRRAGGGFSVLPRR